MNQEENYRLVSKTFSCSSCGRREKRLINPQQTTVICSICNRVATEVTLGEFNREELDRTYRINFNQNGERNRASNQNHNRTDIFDRNPNNIYADPRERVIHLSPEEIQRRNLIFQAQQRQAQNSRFNQSNRSQTTSVQASSSSSSNQTSNQQNFQQRSPNSQNINYNNNHQSQNQRNQRIRINAFDMLFGFPFAQVQSPFSGSVNRHPFSHRFGDFFSDLFFMPSSDEFFYDNYASNFSSNFADPFTRIIFIRTAAPQESQIRGASSEALRRLKKFKMNHEHTKTGENGNIEFPSCSICLTEVNEGEDSILVPCGHIFHESCILKWFEVNNKCPVCRYELNDNRANSTNENNGVSINLNRQNINRINNNTYNNSNFYNQGNVINSQNDANRNHNNNQQANERGNSNTINLNENLNVNLNENYSSRNGVDNLNDPYFTVNENNASKNIQNQTGTTDFHGNYCNNDVVQMDIEGNTAPHSPNINLRNNDNKNESSKDINIENEPL